MRWRDAWQRLDPGQGAIERTHRMWQVTVDTSRSEDASAAAAGAWRAQLEQAIEQAETVRAQAHRELDTEIRAREEATTRAEHAEGRINDLEQRLDAVHAERTIIDAELRRQRITSSALTTELTTARSEVDELAVRLQETRTQLTRSDTDLRAAQAAVATQSALVERAEAERDELQSELATERCAHALVRAALDGARAAHPDKDDPAESVGAMEPSTWSTPAMTLVRDRHAAIDRTDTRWASYAPPILAVLTAVAVLAPILRQHSTDDAAPIVLIALVVALVLLALMVALPRQLYRLVAVPYGPAPSILPGGVSVALLAAVLAATFEGGRSLAGLPAEHTWTSRGIVPVLRIEPTTPGFLPTSDLGAGLMLGAMLAAVLVLVAVGAVAVGVFVRRLREHLDPVAAVVIPAVTALDRLREHAPSDVGSKRAVNDALSRLATNLESVFPRAVAVSGAAEQKAIRELGTRAARAVLSWELRVAQGDPEQLRQLRDDLTRIVSAIGSGSYGDLPVAGTGSPLPRRQRWLTGTARALPVFPPLTLAAALPLQWSAFAERASGTQYLLATVVALWTVSGVARFVDPGVRRQLSRLSQCLAETATPAAGPGTTSTGAGPASPAGPTGDAKNTPIDLTAGQS